jgi:phosphotransferase system enzyme I (PtsI)
VEIKKGIGVSPGFAVGEAFVLGHEEFIFRKTVESREVKGEIERLQKATEEAARELAAHVGRLGRGVAKQAARILESQTILLRDDSLRTEIVEEITRHSHSAEYAASHVLKRKAKQLLESGVPEFAREFTNMEQLVLRHLTGTKREDLGHLTKKVVVVAHEISPAQTVGLDRSKVLGMLTEVGGTTSHTAIVAKSLGIPAVVGVGEIASDATTGDVVILDGAAGTVIVNPDEATLKRYQAMARNFTVAEQRLSAELRDLPAATRDGVKVELLANIELPEDIETALEAGAQGIGLYRTEYLFLTKRFAPTEKDHLEAYRRALGGLGRRRLTIRTLDLGADKMPLEGLPREDNPFLGVRGVRLSLAKPEVMRTQLRAILKASTAGRVAIMVPMIAALEEIERVKEILESVKRDLRREGESFDEKVPFGIMVEVPSAALTADRLAPHVDFFSIGTNDLIAYTLAVDRSNEHVAKYYQPTHPAVLRLLKGIIETGAKHGKPVAVCGEMSSELAYTLLLLGMGLRIFSCVPKAIPEVKKVIRSVTVKEAAEVAKKAMEIGDPKRTLEFLRTETRKILPDLG